MRYVMLGRQSRDWLGRHEERKRLALARAGELGIEFHSIHYTQGAFDFVDIADAPSPEAMLKFSVWYAQQGFGSFQSLPAFDDEAMAAAAREA